MVRIAAAHGVPVWPVSRGRNRGFDSFTAPKEDTAILVLERRCGATPRTARPTALVLMSIFFAKEDAESTARARALCADLQAYNRAAGYSSSRMSVGGMDHLAELSPAWFGLIRRLKAVVDPAGALAPGRYGV